MTQEIDGIKTKQTNQKRGGEEKEAGGNRTIYIAGKCVNKQYALV